MKEGFTFIEASLKLPFKRKFTFRNFGGGGELQKRPSSNSKKKTKNSMRNKTRMIHTDRNNIGGIAFLIQFRRYYFYQYESF